MSKHSKSLRLHSAFASTGRISISLFPKDDMERNIILHTEIRTIFVAEIRFRY